MTSPRTNRAWWLVVTLAVIVALSGGYAIATFAQRADDAEQVAGVGLGVVQEVQQACRAEDANPDTNAIREAGLCKSANDAEKAIADSPTDSTAPLAGTVGPQGPPASFVQVLGAVRSSIDDALLRVCDGDCGGEDGKTGATGRAPTTAEIAAAVVTYCSTRNECTPPAPKDGKDGAAGSNGRDGRDAPVITSSTCNADDQIVLNFDDGTSVTVTNSDCRATVLEPTE